MMKIPTGRQEWLIFEEDLRYLEACAINDRWVRRIACPGCNGLGRIFVAEKKTIQCPTCNGYTDIESNEPPIQEDEPFDDERIA